MHWLALQWPRLDEQPDAPSREALAWWALGFTPRVAWVEEALLLEVSVCERLWGGSAALRRRIFETNPLPALAQQARAATSLIALARLRLAVAGHALPVDAAGLPLATLSAARAHLGVLERLGCRRWGQVDALPRAGLARRFGPELGRALDVAFGRAPDAHVWITPPEHFEQTLELPERADAAPALLWSARRLLQALQHWLAARQQGVLALEFGWTFDQRRLNGQALPPTQTIELRTAEPVRGMEHLQRLLTERLARTPMLAPARAIRLRALATAPWQGATASFLPQDQPRGDALHVFIERVGARLGADQVRAPVPHADHRPECRQGWRAAEQALAARSDVPVSLRARGGQRTAAAPAAGRSAVAPATGRAAARSADVTSVPAACRAAPPVAPTAHALARPSIDQRLPGWPDALTPTWLLRPPQPLHAHRDQPLHCGEPLELIAGPHRIEAGWWAGAAEGEASAACSADAAARDYFIAQSSSAELLWVYRERASSMTVGDAPGSAPRWFLQGVYA